MSDHPIEVAANFLTKLKSQNNSSDFAYEIFFSKSKSTKIDSKDLKVETLTSTSDSGLSFRIQNKGRVGFSFTTSMEPASIEGAIKDAIAISEHMPESEDKKLKPFSPEVKLPANHALLNRYDEKGLSVSIDEKVKIAIDLERRCKEMDKRIKTVRSATFSESEGEVILLNHLGEKRTSRQTHFSSQIYCKAEENGDAQMGGDYQFSNTLSKLPIELTLKNTVESAVELLGATVPSTRNCPAIIRNDVVADLLDFLSSSFFGEEIQKGRSMLKQNQLNEKCFSEAFSLMDDGLLEGGYGSRLFDAEGTASQKTTLVEKGVFKNLILDRASAAFFKLPSTGNATRGIQSPPSPSTTNLYMEPGTVSYEKLIEQMNQGIIITGLMGVHTANAITGSFSLGATGLLVENGKITKPVKGFAVAGNVMDVFKNFTTLGSDLRFFGNCGAVSLLLPELSISGS